MNINTFISKLIVASVALEALAIILTVGEAKQIAIGATASGAIALLVSWILIAGEFLPGRQ